MSQLTDKRVVEIAEACLMLPFYGSALSAFEGTWSPSWAGGSTPPAGPRSPPTPGGKPKFCPKDLVSRGLAASMIVKAKNLAMP